MSHSFSQLFYLKGKHKEKDVKVPIYLRLTVNGQRSELSVSRKVDPQKRSARKGKIKGTNLEANELNQYLDTVRSRINKIHLQVFIPQLVGQVFYKSRLIYAAFSNMSIGLS